MGKWTRIIPKNNEKEKSKKVDIEVDKIDEWDMESQNNF